MKHVTFHLPSFLRRVRIHGGEFDSSARAMNRVKQARLLQADLRIVRGSTIERKQMSTTIKRIALVAVAALGLGVMSVAPSQAAPSGDTLTLSAATASTTSGTAATVTVTQSFLAEAGDTMTITAALISFPAGNTVQPAWSNINAVSTDLGSANVDTATPRVANIGSVTGFVNKSLTLSFNGTVAGTYVIRVTPTIKNPSGLTAIATAKDWTVTVAAKTLGWTSTFVGVYSNGTSDTATADATAANLTFAAAASTTAKARIDVGQGYGATSGSDTATAADAAAVVIATDKGLVSKTNDYTAGAKSVTDAAATDADADYYVFSNGDVGKASITITVGGVLKATKNVYFTGAATALVAKLTTDQPEFAKVGGTTTYTITATDAGATVVTNPTGLTVKSSDTAVATVAIASGVVTVTGVKAGTATITVTDPATTAAATAVSFVATVAPVRPTSVDITFDAPSYNVGDLITMTVSANMGDSATAQLFTSTGVVLSSSVVASGTAIPAGTSHAIVGGKATYKFYAPAVSGNLVVTATSGGAVDVTTAIAISKTVAIANPGVDAATDAANEARDAADAATDAALQAAEAADAATVAAQEASDAVAALSESVTALVAGLQAQIKSLAAVLARIAKKVKA
jgi:trimeric autotransporter adhesin